MNTAQPDAPRCVGDLMTMGTVDVRADAPLAEAARLLDAHRIHGLPVVDATGLLVGVISQTDLLRARAMEYLWANWAGLRVRHLMTSPALTIRQDEPIAAAARKMELHHVHRLVVVSDEDEALGIGLISTSDVVHAMSGLAVDPDQPASAGKAGS
jgi:CBS domain-containing protein